VSLDDHEEHSARIAGTFLAQERYPSQLLDRVIRCIQATKLPQSPTTVEQQALCDADVHHAGTTEFFAAGDLLREEVELRDGVRYDDAAWLEVNLEFLYQHPFHTEYARREFGHRREANIAEVKRRLAQARGINPA
jgi:predicted metal-dependent HD superfamily phosphohydrolase